MKQPATAQRILVLGATGMAGHLIATFLDERGHTVVRGVRDGNGSNALEFDAMDHESVARILEVVAPDVVVNCVGSLVAQSADRPLDAVLLNAALPRFLEATTKGSECRVIHLSTDCVFSGRDGGYTEASTRDGDSVYDRAKALGELDNHKDLTLRMSIIGPEVRRDGSGLLHWALGQSGTVRGYSRAHWNGITTLELARAIDAVLDHDVTGIYHLVPSYSITKHDLLAEILRAFGRIDVSLEPDESVVVDKTLIDTRKCFPMAIGRGGYGTMLDELQQWVQKHPGLYGGGRYERGVA